MGPITKINSPAKSTQQKRMIIRSLVIAHLYLAWDRKLGLLSLARSVNSSKRRRPGMGHLLGEKKKKSLENKFMYIKRKES